MNEKWKNEGADGERNAVRISRDYDFPRKSVFDMFTDSKEAAKFWGPEGAVKLVFEFDARPGGAIRIHDRNSEGNVTKTSGTVTELVAPELLVFQSSTVFREGAAPFVALQTLRFEELGPKRTRVTVLVKILALGSFPADVESLEAGFVGGWGETLDMLQRELH